MASVTKDVLSWLKTWFHTKSEIASLLLGKSDVGHEHETTEMVETTALGNLELTSGATQQEINIAINNKISGGGSTGNAQIVCVSDFDVDLVDDDLVLDTCDLDTVLATKQDLLVSGVNIKTINHNSILGSGNIEISGGGGGDTTIVTGWSNPTSDDVVPSEKLVLQSLNEKVERLEVEFGFDSTTEYLYLEI